jgi:hypothetical protein
LAPLSAYVRRAEEVKNELIARRPELGMEGGETPVEVVMFTDEPRITPEPYAKDGLCLGVVRRGGKLWITWMEEREGRFGGNWEEVWDVVSNLHLLRPISSTHIIYPSHRAAFVLASSLFASYFSLSHLLPNTFLIEPRPSKRSW